MLLMVIGSAQAYQVTLANGLYLLPTSIPFLTGSSPQTLLVNYPLSAPSAQTPFISITTSQLNAMTTASCDYSISITITITGFTLIFTYDNVLATGLFRNYLQLSNFVIFPSVNSLSQVFGVYLNDYTDAALQVATPATASFPLTPGITGISTLNWNNCQFLISLISWKVLATGSTIKVRASITAKTAAGLTLVVNTGQNTVRLQLQLLAYNVQNFVQYNKRRYYSEAGILRTGSSFATAQTLASGTLFTGQVSTQTYFAISGVQYTNINIAPAVIVFNYTYINLTYSFIPNGQYSFINATMALFNEMQCQPYSFFTPYTYDCLLACPSDTMFYSLPLGYCLCLNTMLVYNPSAKTCECLAGYHFNTVTKVCELIVQVTLIRMQSFLSLETTPPVSYTLNDTRLFYSAGPLIYPSGRLLEAYLGVVLPTGNYYVLSKKSLPVKIANYSLIYHWTSPPANSQPLDLPSQLQYVGPVLAVALPALQLGNLLTHLSCPLPFPAFNLLVLFHQIQSPAAGWLKTYQQNYKRLLADSLSVTKYSGLFAVDALFLLALLLGAYVFFITLLVVHSKIKSELVLKVKKAAVFVVFRANEAFAFPIIGCICFMVSQVIPNYLADSARTIASISAACLYAAAFLALLIWGVVRLLTSSYEESLQLMYFNYPCRFVDKQDCERLWTPPFFQLYLLLGKVLSAILIFSLPSNYIAQVTTLGLVNLALLVMLFTLQPFHRMVNTVLTAASLVILLLLTACVLFFNVFYYKTLYSTIDNQQNQYVFNSVGYLFASLFFLYVAVELAGSLANIVFLLRQHKSDYQLSAQPDLKEKENELLLREGVTNRQATQAVTVNMVVNKASKKMVSVIEVQRNNIRVLDKKNLEVRTFCRTSVIRTLNPQRFESLDDQDLRRVVVNNKDERYLELSKCFKELGVNEVQSSSFITIDFSNYQYSKEILVSYFKMRHEISFKDAGGKSYRFSAQEDEVKWLPFNKVMREGRAVLQQ